MNFSSEQESVFLQADSGTFKGEDGREVEWNKITFANPLTYENHELSYHPNVDFSRLQKGQKIKLLLDLQPTNKKSRVLVSGFKIA